MTVALNARNYVIVDEAFLSSTNTEQPNFTQCLENTENSTNLLTFIFNAYAAGNYTKISETESEKPAIGRGKCAQLYHYIATDIDLDSSEAAKYFDDSPTEGHRNLIIVTKTKLNLTTTACNYTDQAWDEETRSYDIDYCFIETKGVPKCRLWYSSYLLYVVAVCNAVKVVCMCLAANRLWDVREPILATVGDATASFLEFPDQMTQNRCIAVDNRSALQTYFSPTPAIYKRKREIPLFTAVKSQWILTMVFCSAYLIAASVLMSPSEGTSEGGIKLPGLNSFDDIGLVWMTMVANSPQVLLSLTYFLYNSLCSAQCAASEWASYLRLRKALRVTWPQGKQRSTYWLSLPYRHSLPLIGCLVLMHFLVSQSINILRTEMFDQFGKVMEEGINSKLSFSSIYLALAASVGGVMIYTQTFQALRGLDNRIPYHQNSSAMISAMCHASDPNECGKKYTKQELKQIATMPLMWGATRQPGCCDEIGGLEDVPGHCSFSAEAVELPIYGKKYE